MSTIATMTDQRHNNLTNTRNTMNMNSWSVTEKYNLPDLIFSFDSEDEHVRSESLNVNALKTLKTLKTFNTNTLFSKKHVCICDCDCRYRDGFFTLAPYRIGHSLVNKKIYVCQHFASCKFSGKTCKKT
jgi:hypothetical protein